MLIVDDIAMNRDIAAAFIRAAGYRVVCAEGGAEAVAAASAHDFLIILMDVRMPGMDGLQAARAIRCLSGPRGQVPIIALTAQIFADQIAAILAAGMDGHLAKPFTLETLLGAIGQGIAGGQLRAGPAGETMNPAAVSTPTAIGSHLKLLDADALDRTAAFLQHDDMLAYLRTLIADSQALHRRVSAPDAIPGDAAPIADSAHLIASSAGLFGFDRLVFLARHFERAVQTDPESVPSLAQEFSATLEASLGEMRLLAEAG